ncbi:YdcH family protein [Flavihumibacter fluvii]|uniref:YdcH family protein n=1 Tax=Flavihumibacter fluvii TaxID=2838157 RepID=UPI001BDEBEF3|nr:DUF465 domain-containing protein [Flavihumibacter fluvii]ULQ54222.1 DUF465 domain-containing protein [Flavihumibacter fluvii]
MDKHYLLNEFPEQKEKIQELKVSDAHFKKLYEEYNAVNHEVERIENGLEPTSDVFLNDLKLKRVTLKDELYGMLEKG